jgi:hypothetical protein
MQANFVYDYSPSFVCLAHKFTGKERDTESGLDYFGARYYVSKRYDMASGQVARLSFFEHFSPPPGECSSMEAGALLPSLRVFFGNRRKNFGARH